METRAEPEGGGYRLTGAKSVVFNAPAADVIAVSARTAGGPRDRGGLTVFALDASAHGLEVREYRTMDGLRAGEIELDGAAGTNPTTCSAAPERASTSSKAR